jgi:hypothetical protein
MESVQYSTVQYSTVQYSTVQYSTVQYMMELLQNGVPNLYEGDMSVEEEVLDWLIEMKVGISHKEMASILADQ